MKAAILGKKIGMSSYYTASGQQVPVTVIEAGPCPVVSIRTPDKDGYSSVQVGYDEKSEKNVIKPVLGQFKKAGVNPTQVLKEFRDLEQSVEIGQTLTVEQFQAGDKIAISGKSKGKGFQGVMKRHNFSGVGMATHGQSDRQRHPGSLGQSSYPSRVFKGIKMAGRMGGKRVTISNLEIVEVLSDKNLILVKGCVPGATNSYLEIVKK